MKILQAMSEASEEPSPTCTKADKHTFKTVMHADGRETYTWLYQCNHCGEYVKKTQKRTGMDKALWS